MSDDDALSGTTDTVRPWTIKAISTQARDQAIAAARGDGVNVGQWLERRIREWAEVPPGPATAGAPGSGPGANPASMAGIADIARAAIALSEVAAEHREDPILRTARATVRAALLALRPPRQAAAPQPKVLRIGTE